MMFQMYDFKHVVYARVYVVYRLAKTFLKEFADRECHLVAWDHLRRRRYPHAARGMYLARFGLELASHQSEECGLPRAVLTHHRHFHSATNRKIHLVEDRFVVSIVKRHFLEAQNALFSCHQFTIPYFALKWKKSYHAGMSRPHEKTADEYPMRINKYLAHEGIATRRGADELVARGKVLVNGHVAVLGERVNYGDTVELRDKSSPKKFLYYAYNKPVGVITHSPRLGEKDIKQSVALPKDVFPVGRLDKDSSGLIILTNDGRVTDRLLNPDYEHDKEYRVRTSEPLRESFKKTMEVGVDIEGYLTKPCTVRKTGQKSFNITLTEGKKHQIRRMVAALHNTVVELERTRILNVRLDNLASGMWRSIEGEELKTFLAQIGMK